MVDSQDLCSTPEVCESPFNQIGKASKPKAR